MVVTITANPCLDRNLIIEKLVSDDTIRPSEITDEPGGSGINVSRVLTRFKRPNVAIGFLGGGTGSDVEALLRREGVKCDFLQVSETTRTNMIISDKSNWEQYRFSFPGPSIRANEVDGFMDKLASYSDATYWAIGGSIPKDVPTTFYNDIVDLGHKMNIRVVLDSYGDPFHLGLEAKPFMVKPNEFELSRIVGMELSDFDSHVEGARVLQKRGVDIVVASMGAEGAVLVSDEGIWHAKPPKVEVKSKVGAGDSTVAGVLMALDDGKGYEEAVRLGVSAGTATTLTFGTELCYQEDVDRIYAETKVRRL